jgi:hypothetical protein
MAEYSTLYIGGHNIAEFRDCVDEDIAILFTEEDITHEPHPNWKDQWIYNEGDERLDSLPCFQYESTSGQLIDRLELLGYSINGAKQLWDDGVQKHLGEEKELDRGLAPSTQDTEVSVRKNPLYRTYSQWCDFYKKFTFNVWSGLMKEIIEHKLKPIYTFDSEQRNKALKRDNSHIRYILTNFHDFYFPYGFPTHNMDFILRAMLELLDRDTPVVLDCSILVGWVAPALYACAPPKTVILTEGTSDRTIIEGTLRLLYPHLHPYFSFVDFEVANMPGSAGHLLNMIKAFVATGVSRRTIAIFDNDAAGHDCLRQLATVPVPEEIKVITLPYLELAERYPTIGPQGSFEGDINGAACSLELYLGRDMLEEAPGKLTPVKYGGFMPGVKRWQGEIVNKQVIHKRYMKFLSDAADNPDLMKTHDWSGMRHVLQTIFDSFKGQAPIRVNEL